MCYKTLLIGTFCAFLTSGFSQNSEVQVDYRFGFPLKNVRILSPSNFTRYDHLDVQSHYDHGFLISYHHEIWDKLNLFLNVGTEFSRSVHSQKIIGGISSRHLDNIIIKNDRVTFHLGLIKKIMLFNDKASLNIGYDLTYRHTWESHKEYSSDFKSNNEGWIKYKYELNIYSNKYYETIKLERSPIGIYLPSEFKVKFEGSISEKMSINFGLSYTRQNFFYFHYSNQVNYYQGGSTTPTYTYQYLGVQGGQNKTAIVNDYLYFGFGLNYKL